jgi:hypothetical protein
MALAHRPKWNEEAANSDENAVLARNFSEQKYGFE